MLNPTVQCDLHIDVYNFSLYINSIFVIHQTFYSTSLKSMMDQDVKGLTEMVASDKDRKQAFLVEN